MVDWAYVNGYADDGGDPDHDIRDPEGHCGTEPHQHSYGPRVRCMYCRSTDVYWQNDRGKHRLHNKTDLALHQCRDKINMNDEGFDDVG